MNKIVTCGLNENFIGKLTDFVEENFPEYPSGINRLAFVFEGKRPALFLQKSLSERIEKSFFAPSFFSIDEFVQYTLAKKTPFTKIPNMECWYMIYSLARDIAPGIIKGREKFSQFLPWAREIANFIDLLDTENVALDSLKNIQAAANIGYEIPESINTSLRNIIAIRQAYHKLLVDEKSFSKGFIYLSASQAVKEVNFDEFDKIFFCGFFYIQKTVLEIIKHLFDNDKAILFFQGDRERWPSLKEASRVLGCPIEPAGKEKGDYTLKLHSAFDRHSQVCAVREILKKTENLSSTAIILPDPNSVIPLVSEIASLVGEFNISLGYPLKRSSVYSLFDFIVRAQKTQKKAGYYAKDYIAVLSQPLVKNLKISFDHRATRVLVHKIEEALLGIESTSISGSLFVKLEDIEKERGLFELAVETLRNMGIEVTIPALQEILAELHLLLFKLWEGDSDFSGFAASLEQLMDALVRKSFIASYPLNLKIAKRIYSLKDELRNAPFCREEFATGDIFRIFQSIIENEVVSFSGSPLRGLQVIGMLETRCLNFENVIIMDVNESKLPKLHIRHPLIPPEVILGLGLDIVDKARAIQSYLVARMVSAAKNVHFVYQENSEAERSRFVEEFLWQAQKDRKALDVMPVEKVGFRANVLPLKMEVKKTPEMVEALRGRSYSASSVNTYLNCPLQFYYRYVLGLEEKEELSEEPEAREIGTFIHQLLEYAFSRFVEKKPEINQKFRRDFFRIFENKFKKTFSKRMRSDSFLLEKVMRFRLERFLDFEESSEQRKEVEQILYLEKQFSGEIELSGDMFKFRYIVDRVDRLSDGSILILDYKTGSDTLKPQGTELLETMEMTRESIRDRLKSFQLPLYYYFEKKKYQRQSLNAALYGLRNPRLTYFADKQTDPGRAVELCLNALDMILHEILDPAKTFNADLQNENKCRYCPFFYLCR